MKPNNIEFQPLIDWAIAEEVSYAYSHKERKRLIATLYGGFRVYVAGRMVWEGTQAAVAVEKYNQVIEKYIDPTQDFVL